MQTKRIIHNGRDIADFITESAKQQNIRVGSLEEKVEVSLGLVSRWKNGHCAPRLNNLLDILEILNIELVARQKVESEKEKWEDIVEKVLTFLNQQNSNLELGPIEQKIGNLLQSDVAKIVGQLLLFEDMSLEEKKAIHQMLELMIFLDEHQ